MKHRLLALLVSIALLLTPLGASAEALPAAAQGASLAMQYGGASSLSYAVYRDGQIVTRGTVSAAAPGEVQDAQPLYGVGSVSKVYTAAAVMKLCEAGLLTLDTPVADALPNFSMDDPRYADITVRMLLNHASGLMFAGMRDAFLFGQTSNNTAVSSLLGELRTQRLIADPGAYSVYCNTGFTLAQLVAEEVSGMPLHDYLREAFFAPLGLADTFAAADDFDRARLAPAYLPADNRPVSADCVTITGTGGLYATAEDLARFGGMLAGDGDALTDGSRAAMAQPEYARGFWPTDSEDDALSFGLGWDMVHMFPFNRSGVQALCKGGDTNLYHAGLVVLPEYGMAAAVLSSGGLSTYNQLLCARLLIDELAAQGVIIDESAALPAAEPATMPEEMTAYSGVYAASTGAVDVQITPDGALTLTMGQQAGGYQQLFVYCADGTFRDATGTVLVRPETAANGQTYLFQRAYSPVPGLTAMGVGNYFGMRLPESEADEATLAAWHARDGKRYFLLNAHYASQIYALALPCTFVAFESFAPGYIAANQLTGPDEARAVVQAPGTAGRDGMDMAFYTEDGVEYLTAPGCVYADESVVAPLEAQMQVTIAPDGYARYFSVGEALSGKTLRVTRPERGSFAVYRADMTVSASSAAYGDTGAPLEAGGIVVFAGEPGETFGVTAE